MAARWGIDHLDRHYAILRELSEPGDGVLIASPAILPARLLNVQFGRRLASSPTTLSRCREIAVGCTDQNGLDAAAEHVERLVTSEMRGHAGRRRGETNRETRGESERSMSDRP